MQPPQRAVLATVAVLSNPLRYAFDEAAQRLAADLEAQPGEVLLVGNGALLYKELFESAGPVVEVAGMNQAFPNASSLVELALPRLYREDFDSLYDLRPLYLRKSAKPIEWARIRQARPA